MVNRKEQRLLTGLLFGLIQSRVQSQITHFVQDPEFIKNIADTLNIEDHANSLGIATQKHLEESQMKTESQIEDLQKQLDDIKDQIEN